MAPGELAVGRRERVDEAVERADVDAPVGRRGRRVEAPGLQPEGAAGARGLPDLRAVALADGVDLAAVVAEEQPPPVEGQPALDRAVGLVAPAHVAVAGAQRVDGAVLGAEVDAPAGHQRRGLGARGELARPAHAAVLDVERDHAPALDPLAAREDDGVDAVARARRRRGGQVADLRLPADPARQAADLVERAVVLLHVQRAPAQHRRELDELAAGHAPLRHERRAQGHLQRQVARARLVVAELRPGEAVIHRMLGGFRLALGARRLRGLRVRELDVRVRDVARLRRREERDRRPAGHDADHAHQRQPPPPAAPAREHAPRVPWLDWAMRSPQAALDALSRRPVRRAASERLRARRRRARRRRRRARPAPGASVARDRPGRRGRRRGRGGAPGRGVQRLRALRDARGARRRVRLRARARARRELRAPRRAARRAARDARGRPAAPRRDDQRHRPAPRRDARARPGRARGPQRPRPARPARRVLRRRPHARVAHRALRRAAGLRGRARTRARWRPAPTRRTVSGDRLGRRAAPGPRRARPARRAARRRGAQPGLPARGLRHEPPRARPRAGTAARADGRRDLLTLAACTAGMDARALLAWLDDMGFAAADRDLVAAASRYSTGEPLRAARTNAEIARAARGAPAEAVALAGGENARRWLRRPALGAPGDQRRRPAGRRDSRRSRDRRPPAARPGPQARRRDRRARAGAGRRARPDGG